MLLQGAGQKAGSFADAQEGAGGDSLLHRCGLNFAEDGGHLFAELVAMEGRVEIQQASVDSEHGIRSP